MSEGSVCIIGLGLIGGSLARDLAAAGRTVIGYDANPATLAAARDEGVVSSVLDDSLPIRDGQTTVVIATPVSQVAAVLERIAAQSIRPRLITDVSSTKAEIVGKARAFGLAEVFVGAHPLTGDHRSGWSSSRRGLFNQAIVFLCPAAPARTTLDRAEVFWRSTGAQTLVLSAEAHDERMAIVSHLPQLFSTLLAALIAEQGYRRSDLGPGGRDMTRLAGSDADIWLDILLTNREHLLARLDDAADLLSALRLALRQSDAERLRALLDSGRALS